MENTHESNSHGAPSNGPPSTSVVTLSHRLQQLEGVSPCSFLENKCTWHLPWPLRMAQ